MQNLVEKFDENCVKIGKISNIYDALRVLPAVTRLTVYRRLQVMMAGLFFEFLRSFLPIDFVLTNFTATFRYYFSGS